MSPADEKMVQLRNNIDLCRSAIAHMFAPGAFVTVVVRHPDYGHDASIVVTDDEFASVITTLDHQMSKE